MALVKYGGGVVDMRGSIAGNTFSRNRYGNYIRAKTMPINPNSVFQQVVRAAIAFLTERWYSTVTEAQRSAWATYAAGVSMNNKLGESIHLSGFNHYIRSNSILKQLGLAPIDAGPTVLEIPEQDPTFAITASEATQLISVAGDDTMEWLDEDLAYLVTFMGVPQNITRNFFDGPWRVMDSIAGDSVTPPTLPDTQTAPFTLTEGQKIWTYARIIRADGRVSTPFRNSCTIAA